MSNDKKDYGWIINIIVGISTIVFGIIFFIDIFLPLVPLKTDRTTLILNLLLFQIGILVVYLLIELPKRNKIITDIEKSAYYTEVNLKSAAQSLNTLSNINNSKLLTGEALNSEYFLFDGFNENDYYAVNAPLQFELHNPIRKQIDIHRDRYKSSGFNKAHYSYPIFNSLKKEEKREWITGILSFLEQLSQVGLSEEHKKKITFYIPKNENEVFKNNNCSYFIGSKIGIKQCITYLHISPFFNFELRKPNSILIIYSDTVINEIQDIVINENMKMRKIEGIDEFINYCKTQI